MSVDSIIESDIEKSTIEEILKAYKIKRKAGRADWGELPRNYALSNDLSRVSTLTECILRI